MTMPKLLVVDDELDVCEFAKRFFTKRNIEVLTATSGREALQLIKDEKPDLVLLDLLLGEGMTGIDVLEYLRTNKNDTKVVIVTGSEDEKTVSEANRLGVSGFVHKPLILGELEKIVLEQLKE